MMIPSTVFSLVILAALVLVIAAPLILVGLFLRDWRRGQLW